MRLTLLILLSAFGLLCFSSPAAAQKARVGKAWYEDHHNGYKFRYPEDWSIAPVQPGEKRLGIQTQMGGPGVSTRIGGEEGTQVGTVQLRMVVVRIDSNNVAVTPGEEEEDGGSGLRGRVQKEATRDRIEDFIGSYYGGLRDLTIESEKEEKFSKARADHREIHAWTGNWDTVFDTFTFSMDDYDIVLVFEVPQQHAKKWMKVFRSSAKTFTPIEVVEEVERAEGTDYESVLAKARDEVDRTPGWDVVEVPSQRYILKTSSKDKKFLKEVVERLEKSRDLYERDFPPAAPIEHISIVRVCSTMEEFHTYGKTGGGVAGWFNPGTTELVIVDFREYNRAMTYGVMSHEAFHQYCHFLFDESEAHRWFDEGHGDYYGGFEFKGRKAIPTPKMAPGLERLTGIKAMIRNETYKPLKQHLNFNHSQWQNQGPSNVSCYEQSWSIIYMLRQGMLGKVPRRVWQEEYADILPNYVRVLHRGYLDKYDEIRERENIAEEYKVNRRDLSEDDKLEIWQAAMDASWGQIDLDQFEEDWVEYVSKHIK